jgi:hypothetical protein
MKVNCNDSLNPFMELRFRAIVNDPKQKLKTTPSIVDFGVVPVGIKSKAIINLVNTDSTESNLVIIENPASDLIKNKIKKTKLKPEDSTKIEFTLSNKVPVGTISSSLTLEAKGKPGSRITIPIKGTVSEEKKK